jgi:hypothetical protein
MPRFLSDIRWADSDTGSGSNSFKLRGNTLGEPTLEVLSTANNANAGVLKFSKRRDDGLPVDDDLIGWIRFAGEDGGGTANDYGIITCKASEVDAGNEAGEVQITVSNDGVARNGLKVEGVPGTAERVDVAIGNGLTSVTTIAGDTTTWGGTQLRASEESESPNLSLVNWNSDAGTADFLIVKYQSDDFLGTSGSAANADEIGGTSWVSLNSADEVFTYARETSFIESVTDGQEAGKMSLGVATSNGTTSYLAAGFSLTGRASANPVLIDADIGLGISSTTTVAGNLTVNGETINCSSSVAQAPTFSLTNYNTDAGTPDIAFLKLQTDDALATPGSATDGDEIGGISWFSLNEADQQIQYAHMLGYIEDAGDGVEAGKWAVGVAASNGTTSSVLAGITLTGDPGALKVNVNVANGAASLTTVAGSLTVGGGKLGFDGVDLGGIQTSAELFVDNDTSLMTSAAIEDRIATAGGGLGTSFTTAELNAAISDGSINIDQTNISGNANTVTTNASLTGHITSVGNAASLGAFTVSELSTALSDATLSGNNSGDQTNILGNAVTVTNGVYTTDNLSVFAATTSAQLSGILSDETGSGYAVFATNPVLVGPTLGTPASGNLVNCDGINYYEHVQTPGTTPGETGAGAEIVKFGTGSVVAGFIYQYSGGSWVLANADAESTSSKLLGVALSTNASATTAGICVRGMVTLDTDTTGDDGDILWLKPASAGNASSDVPTTGTHIARVIGYCLDADGVRIFFNPDNTFVEID